MRLLKRILIGLVVVIVVLAGIGLMLPRNARLERSTVIEAPAATVFTLLNSYKRFNEWSPWADLDPNTKYAYEGPTTGVGAKMSWEGDPKKVGAGSQEIVESRPFELVRNKLNFGPQGEADAAFTLAPEGGGTRLTWGFETDLGMNPVSRYMGLAFDSMLGPHYEKGLAALKKLAESLPKADFSDLQVEVIEVSPAPVAYVSATCGKEEQEIAKTIGDSYAQVALFLTKNRLKQVSPPLTINTKWDDTGYGFDAAIPIDRMPDKEIPSGSPVQVKQTYGGKALKVVHKGAYRGMPQTYEKLMAYSAAHGYEKADHPWDEYVSDPGNTPEPDLITNVYLPVK
jgi:effector-binding domain-containing protein/uncharacterized protein YndB with AHSA1/START domain